ncbi:nickel/cobalt transporter [Candidatus Bathyarchaeota archaeon]|nr:nickel/cobalt transporter [Candidatus Bathyarchaeota archaeon]
MLDTAFLGIVMLGLLHGLEPGHGWPVAFMYSVRKGRPLLYGLLSSAIISLFHFISSVAVVVAYVLISSFITVSIPLLKYAAAAALIILAYVFFTENISDELETQHGHLHDNSEEIEHEHEHGHSDDVLHTHRHKHSRRMILSLSGIATFAFLLGFAHEEEFALLALAVGGIDPLMLMLFYAASVTFALIGVTLLCVKAYETVQARIRRYEKLIPKASALILLLMAVALILDLA